MPRLARLALGLDEEHRLHHLDIRADHLGEDVHHRRRPRDIAKQPGNLMWKVDTQVAPQHLVGVAVGGYGALDLATLAAADRGRLGAGGIDQRRIQDISDDQEALISIGG
jgi:hypothetical protein